MGDERAETYLRLVAERELRRVIGGRMWTSDIAASALRNLHRAGRILIAAGAVDGELVDRLAAGPAAHGAAGHDRGGGDRSFGPDPRGRADPRRGPECRTLTS